MSFRAFCEINPHGCNVVLMALRPELGEGGGGGGGLIAYMSAHYRARN